MKNFQRLMAALVVSCVQFAAYAEERAIEEIVVTATKRDTTVMEVPASVTAFTAEQLEEREIESVLDLNGNAAIMIEQPPPIAPANHANHAEGASSYLFTRDGVNCSQFGMNCSRFRCGELLLCTFVRWRE